MATIISTVLFGGYFVLILFVIFLGISCHILGMGYDFPPKEKSYSENRGLEYLGTLLVLAAAGPAAHQLTQWTIALFRAAYIP